VFLVLTILALFAVIVTPRLASGLLRNKLDAAADALHADLTFAHARAISTGLRHQLLVDSSTGDVLVLPVHPEEAAATGASTAQTMVLPALQDRIPDDVKVTGWNVYPLATGAQTNQATSAADGSPLVFYPEGTSDSAQIVLEDGAGNRRGVEVDGYTGDIRELSAEELAQR